MKVAGVVDPSRAEVVGARCFLFSVTPEYELAPIRDDGAVAFEEVER